MWPRSTEVTPYILTYGIPVKNTENRQFLHKKSYEWTLSISDDPETYGQNSWGPLQRFCLNQRSSSTEVTPYTQTLGNPVKNEENRHFQLKSDLQAL